MDSLDAVREMLARSGVTPYRLALRLGRSPAYVSGMLRRGSVPSADLLAEMAAALGYKMQLTKDGGSITIDGGPGDG